MTKTRVITLSSTSTILMLSFLTLLYNWHVLDYVAVHYKGGGLSPTFFAVTFGIVLLLALIIIFSILLIPRFSKVLVPFIVILNSICLYFIHTYHAFIDSTMAQNVLQTDLKESLELVNFHLILYLLIGGVLPALLFAKLKIRYAPFYQEVKLRLLVIGVSFVGLLGFFFTMNQDYASFLRLNREIKHLILPINYLDASKVLFQNMKPRPRVITPIGLDARLGSNWKHVKNKTILVLVIGETARAQNFSLNGYQEETNPLLKKLPILSYENVHSCGTSTAVSLPCLFSKLGRKEFNSNAYRENLLDIAKRVGFQILWRDNNSGGCKGVCDRVTLEGGTEFFNPKTCEEKNGCLDEAMLYKIREKIDQMGDKILIVFHQLGSHGPAYYLRYPKEFEHFKPICKTDELSQCSREEITNAYDNSILYTDHLLAKTIETLQNISHSNSALFFISDHGESLGENNLYLHGLPYWMAPDEQTRVPFLFWGSKGFLQNFQLDFRCLKKHETEPYTHDHFFHSVLGAIDIKTSAYNPSLDIFDKCKLEMKK